MDVSRFPFDTQNCSLYFSSWSYNANEMMFVNVPDDPKDRIYETEEWNIISFDVNDREHYKTMIQLFDFLL